MENMIIMMMIRFAAMKDGANLALGDLMTKSCRCFFVVVNAVVVFLVVVLMVVVVVVIVLGMLLE